MEINDILMLEVTTPKHTYVLIKQHEAWVLDNEPTAELDQETVNLFVSRVVDLPAEISHPEHSPSAVHHGLDSPSAIIRGRNRQGQKNGQLVLGIREKGLVFARGAGHKGLYQVRSTILDQIPTQEQFVRTGNSNQ